MLCISTNKPDSFFNFIYEINYCAIICLRSHSKSKVIIKWPVRRDLCNYILSRIGEGSTLTSQHTKLLYIHSAPII